MLDEKPLPVREELLPVILMGVVQPGVEVFLLLWCCGVEVHQEKGNQII